MSTPSLDQSRKPLSSGLRSTTCCGDAPARVGPVGGPFLDRLFGACGLCEVSGALSLSLSVEEGRSTFGSVAGLLAKF